MRLVTFTTPALPAGQCRVGVLAEGRVVDIFAACYARARQRGDSPAEAHHTASAMAPPDMVAFFAAGDLGRRTAGSAVAFAIDALRAGDDIAGPGDPVVWPAYTDQLDFELEVGFFTGRGGRNISAADAPAHIAGVTLFNDFSARDIQLYEMALTIGPSKGKDFCTAMGPCVLTMDEVDEFDIACTARVNGEVWAAGTTGNRRFSFAEVLAWASYGEDVYPGEFLAVGTVGGGCGLELDRWIKPGDVVELEAAGIGVLRNPVGAREQAPPDAGLPTYTGSPRVGAH